MTMVGIFAGRGDIIIAMGMTAVVFYYLGWKSKALKDRIFKRNKG